MKKIYCKPMTMVVNVTVENLMQSTSRTLGVSGTQSNESALGRGSSWDDDDEY